MLDEGPFIWMKNWGGGAEIYIELKPKLAKAFELFGL
jgi:hypothetical protein